MEIPENYFGDLLFVDELQELVWELENNPNFDKEDAIAYINLIIEKITETA